VRDFCFIPAVFETRPINGNGICRLEATWPCCRDRLAKFLSSFHCCLVPHSVDYAPNPTAGQGVASHPVKWFRSLFPMNEINRIHNCFNLSDLYSQKVGISDARSSNDNPHHGPRARVPTS
jgi:hypothetical protein